MSGGGSSGREEVMQKNNSVASIDTAAGKTQHG